MLKDQIQSDLVSAMKQKDETTVSVLRMLNASIKNYEIDKQRDYSATDDEIQILIQKEAKKRNESIEMYKKAGRQDLVDKETKERKVLETYMPEQLSDEELETIIKQALDETGATSPQDMGKIMGAVMPKVKGKADGKRVGAIAQKLLSAQ